MNRLNDSVPVDIKHVSYVVNDIETAAQRFHALMGLQFHKKFEAVFANGQVRGKATQFSAKIAVAEVGAFAFELLQPLSGDTIWKEFLAEKGEGVHHVGAIVTNLEQETARLKGLGVELLQWGETNHAKVAFFDMSKTTGMWLELLEHK